RSNDLGRFAEEQTDADGEFEFTLPRTVYTEASAIVLGLFGKNGSAHLGPLAIDRSRDDLVLVVPAPLVVEGRIEGLANEEHAGVSLRFTPAHFAASELEVSPSIFERDVEGRYYRIGEDGHFRFEGLAAGDYVLCVEPVQNVKPSARVVVRAGDRNVLVRLGDGLDGDVVFACLVLDARTRTPVPNAEVEVRGPNADSIVRGAGARTGGDGRCELLGHASGAWFLDVRALDYARRPERFVEYGPGRHSVELELSPCCAVDVELVDATGAPLAGIEVGVTTKDGVLLDLLDSYGNWNGCITRTNVAGRARLTGLPMGPARVVVGWIDGSGARELGTTAWSNRIDNVEAFAFLEAELLHDRRVRARRMLR
ncbi:MAG: hypothetical protein ACKV2T_01730, partial [Kofleriaceae bacterium]